MRKDNMFYVKPRKPVPMQPEQVPETVSYEELYELWLRPKLLSTPPMKLYPKPLVDFAELVLDDPDGGVDWFEAFKFKDVKSVLGFCLAVTAESEEKREFSSVAMEFVGSKYELGIGTRDYYPADEMCSYLIEYLKLDRIYFRVITKGDRLMLKGTKAFRQESGLRVWLEYSTIY